MEGMGEPQPDEMLKSKTQQKVRFSVQALHIMRFPLHFPGFSQTYTDQMLHFLSKVCGKCLIPAGLRFRYGQRLLQTSRPTVMGRPCIRAKNSRHQPDPSPPRASRTSPLDRLCRAWRLHSKSYCTSTLRVLKLVTGMVHHSHVPVPVAISPVTMCRFLTCCDAALQRTSE